MIKMCKTTISLRLLHVDEKKVYKIHQNEFEIFAKYQIWQKKRWTRRIKIRCRNLFIIAYKNLVNRKSIKKVSFDFFRRFPFWTRKQNLFIFMIIFTALNIVEDGLSHHRLSKVAFLSFNNRKGLPLRSSSIIYLKSPIKFLSV